MILFTTLALAAAVPGETASARPAPEATNAATRDEGARRLELARQAIDFAWPRGTYQRMMGEAMQDMVNGMMGAVFDMKVGELSDEDKAAADKSMREAIAARDPHFEERMRITNRVMIAEMTPVFDRIEPKVRQGLAKAYAGKFTAAQLADIIAFFETPTGRVYAAESMLLFMDPEVMKGTMSAMPELIRTMPDIGRKIEAATAHLPPPPKPERDEGDAEEGEAEPTA